VSPFVFVAIAVGAAIVLLIGVGIIVRVRKGMEQGRFFAQAEAAFGTGQVDAAFRLYREGYVVTFEGDADAIRTLDNRAIISRVRELFAQRGRTEPAALAALAEHAEKELLRSPSTKSGSRFRQMSPHAKGRSASTKRRSPIAKGASTRYVNPQELLRKFVPTARPYGFFEDLATPEAVNEAIAACTRDDLHDIAEAASWRTDDDPLVRFVMLELDPWGLRNIDTDSLFTAEDLALMLQEIALLSRGILSASGAAATLDLAASRASLTIGVKGALKSFTVMYRGSRIDRFDVVKGLNGLLAEADSPRRYGLFDTKGSDFEVACLLPEQWEKIEKEGFVPLLQEPA